MFTDSVSFSLSSGNGGSGCSSFRREKFVTKGGPDGGDGGDGGNVYFVISHSENTLSKFKGKNVLKASNGANGMSSRRSGKKGEDLILKVPPGTQVVNDDNGEVLLDLIEQEEKVLLLKGGKGGLGNYHFKNSRNQAPRYHQPGIKGEKLNIRLELKLIADIALVGYPNVGKSTLISTISNSKAKIANYAFTTLTPNLGVVNVGDYDSFVLADIPGIIEGASGGAGLGIEFLKHIQRTNTLLFLLDCTHSIDILTQFKTLQKELKAFSQKLYKQQFSIMISKSDVLSDEELLELTSKLTDEFNARGVWLRFSAGN